MHHPKRIGDRTTLAVMLGLQASGFDVFVPFGENTRYDLVIDGGGKLARVQCKTGRLRRGAVEFRACSTYQHHARPRVRSRDYKGEIDYFGVYCAETGGVYLIPIEAVDVRFQGLLRVDPPRNHQTRRIRLAADYEIVKVAIGANSPVDAPTAAPGGRPGAG